MPGGRPLARKTPDSRTATVKQQAIRLERRPNLPDEYIYVGDPLGTQPTAPDWLNGFDSIAGLPIGYRHGLDGDTDMVGAYDLTTGGPVSGTIAFMMPNAWAFNAPLLHSFPVVLDQTGSEEDWVMSNAIQMINPDDSAATAGAVPVRIYWPIVATPYP